MIRNIGASVALAAAALLPAAPSGANEVMRYVADPASIPAGRLNCADDFAFAATDMAVIAAVRAKYT